MIAERFAEFQLAQTFAHAKHHDFDFVVTLIPKRSSALSTISAARAHLSV